jgi:hypothetical protein
MEKRLYLPLVDLVKTNGPYENTSMPLIISVKFFLDKEAKYSLHYLSE